ncbi:MAG: PAS domain S-box protein [Nitrospirae bacterium]|nr:PAS domain S-box protein [Nitrospirota bacterium]
MNEGAEKTKEQLIGEESQPPQGTLNHKILKERYRAIVEFANDAIMTANVETGIIVDVNQKALELFGYSREEIIGMHQRQLHPVDVLEENREFSKIFVQHVKKGKSYEGKSYVEEDKMICKDGTILDVSISAGVIDNGDEKLIIGIFRDITTQKRLEQINRKKLDITERYAKEQGILNSILKISLSPDSLATQLQMILEIILTNTMISLHSKGSIYLCDERNRMLQIIACHNFSEEQKVVCSKIPYGTCICGSAASTKRIVFSSDCSEGGHTITYRDMTRHGHYCIPIAAPDKLLGVINIYVDEGYERNDRDKLFLINVAQILAGVIERKHVEGELDDYRKNLETLISLRTRELKESEKKYRQLTELSQDGVVVIDETNIITLVNKAMADMLGYTVEEMIGVPVFKLIDELAKQTTEDAIIKLRKAGVKVRTEDVFIRKDGGKITVSVAAVPILDDNQNSSGSFAVVRDITALKKAELDLKRSLIEKDVLLEELQHRVKNNLQVISGLLRLNIDNIKDKSDRNIFVDTITRIRTIALVYDRLHHTEYLSDIDFKRYVTHLSDDIFIAFDIDRNKIDIKLDVRNFVLDVDSVVPCGLIINEILTNILKHAFKDNRAGEILLAAHILDNNEVEIFIKDNGVGLPEGFDFKNARTLGLTLIGVLINQLEGTIEFNGSNGTEVRIRFKPEKGH